MTYPALAAGHSDVDETTGVDSALVGAALGSLGLLLGINLGGGALDLACDVCQGLI